MNLIVKQPFGLYAKGDAITDANDIKAVLAGENAAHVVQVGLTEPKPEEER